MRNGIVHFFAGAEEIKDSTLDSTASPASKTFNESRPRRLRHLMSLALPVLNCVQDDDYACFQCMFCLIGHVHVITAVLSTEGQRMPTCLRIINWFGGNAVYRKIRPRNSGA